MNARTLLVGELVRERIGDGAGEGAASLSSDAAICRIEAKRLHAMMI